MSENDLKRQEDPAGGAERPTTASIPPAGHEPTTVDWSKPRVLAILTAAVRCFARSGCGTTTAEIAAEIGIPKSVIYRCVDDKGTLVREAQRFAYTEHLDKLREALGTVGDAGHGVVDRLRQLWKEPATRNIA